MTWEAWLTVLVVIALLTALVRNWAPPDAVMLTALLSLVVIGEVTGSQLLPSAGEAVSGLGNSGLISVGVLFVVVAGLVQTGAMELVARPLLGHPQNEFTAQVRLMSPVLTLSAFLNNTPVVAMFMPVVEDICKRTRISPSKLYLPMAFAATFGGVCTLVGTSTNLIVNGMVIEAAAEDNAAAAQRAEDTGSPAPQPHALTGGMRMFDITWVGLPCALVAVAYLLTVSRWLLPDRKPAITRHDDPRQYTVELIVQDGGPLVGKSIEEAGLRHLPGLFLVEIERNDEILAAVASRERLRGGDRLVFVGVVESVVDLRKLRGLTTVDEPAFKLDAPPLRRQLIEAVVSDRCPLIGTSIRDGQFRTVYDAAIVAVARGSHRVAGKIGDIVLRPGDTLLLETDQDFVARQHNSSHFFLVSGIENSQPVRHELAWLAVALLVVMIVVVSLDWMDLLTSAFIVAGVMVATQCCSIAQARQSVDWSLLVVIAASLGIGNAVQSSGLANVVAEQIIGLAGGKPWLVLLAVYFVTMLFTELITNNAAAVLVFPIAWASAKGLEVSPMPFIIAVAIGASAGFATPFGYQTNLMVYGPGGYRFGDYVRIGLPLDFVFLGVTVCLAPLVWPF